QHAPELFQGAFLLDQVVEGLVAEQDVDGRVGQPDAGAVAGDQLYLQTQSPGFGPRTVDAVRVGIEADQHARREGLLQQAERAALAAAGVEQYRCLRQRRVDQALEVVDCHAQYMVLPDVALQEPEAEAGFLDVGGGGAIHRQLLLSAGFYTVAGFRGAGAVPPLPEGRATVLQAAGGAVYRLWPSIPAPCPQRPVNGSGHGAE